MKIKELREYISDLSDDMEVRVLAYSSKDEGSLYADLHLELNTDSGGDAAEEQFLGIVAEDFKNV
jgi:hypothetical protein